MKSFKSLFIAGTTWLVIYACSKAYLDKRPLGQIDETALANKEGLERLLIGAYSLLDGFGSSKVEVGEFGSGGSNWVYGSICGSEAYKGGENNPDQQFITDLETFKPTADNSYLASKWATVYDGAQRANDVLRIMQKAKDISPEDQKRIAAEARFLRAHYHFEAKKMWNNVPFIDETITYANQNYHVSNQRDIWPDIENDLIYAKENLDVTSYRGAFGRANKYTAMALLAKVYMFQKDKITKAKPLLDSIINYGPYRLMKNYADNFSPERKNGEESIFSAQTSVNDGSNGLNGNPSEANNFPNGGGPVGCCGFFKPSQYLVNHFKTNSDGLPDHDNFNDGNVKNDIGIASDSSFIPYTGFLDPRLDWTVGRRGIPYLDWGNHPGNDWVRSQSYSGPYNPKKNAFSRSQEVKYTDLAWPAFTALNINLIRYADVLLWAAEVEVEMGNFNKAEEYVNMIRNRAADPSTWVHTYIDPSDPLKGFTNIAAANYRIKPYPAGYFASKGEEFARKAVRYERMLELGMEGHRFFDLVRWGIADIEINAYLEKEKRPYFDSDVRFRKDCNEYFPIPQREIDLSAGADGVKQMIQNRCYN